MKFILFIALFAAGSMTWAGGSAGGSFGGSSKSVEIDEEYLIKVNDRSGGSWVCHAKFKNLAQATYFCAPRVPLKAFDKGWGCDCTHEGLTPGGSL